jgi:hypothetical protein
VLANVKALNSQTFYDERMCGKQKAGEVRKEGDHEWIPACK